MEFHGAGGLAGFLVCLDFLGETPVVGEAGGAGVLAEMGVLAVVGAELCLVGPENDHVGGFCGSFCQLRFPLLRGLLLSRWLFLILTPRITHFIGIVSMFGYGGGLKRQQLATLTRQSNCCFGGTHVDRYCLLATVLCPPHLRMYCGFLP